MAIGKIYLLAYNVCQFLGWSVILGLTIYQSVHGKQFLAYERAKIWLRFYQTAAFLEVVHAAIGLVRSPVMITLVQIMSRNLILWGILFSVPDNLVTHSYGALFLLIAWSITEVIRYSFYALSIISIKSYFVTWCRYTFFIILYPLGVLGELWCLFTALPLIAKRELFYYKMPNQINFSFDYSIFLVMVALSYIPFFPQLYLYMFSQRGKVLHPKSA